MATASEIKKFIDDADSQRKELGEYRMMVMRAHGILLKIDGNGKKVPAWLQYALTNLREALTLEPRD